MWRKREVVGVKPQQSHGSGEDWKGFIGMALDRASYVDCLNGNPRNVVRVYKKGKCDRKNGGNCRNGYILFSSLLQ